MKDLEEKLKNSEFLGGASPSIEDKEAYELLKGTLVQAKTHPHTFGWFCLIGQFSEGARNSWTAASAQAKGGKKEGGKKGKQGKKQEKKKEEDFGEDDLFGDDPDDGEAAKKAQAAAKEGAKKKKKEVIAMSLVMLEVKPLDDTIDLDVLAQRLFKEITQEGLFWKTEYKKEPVAFGIFKLVVAFSLEDLKVSVDDVVERIEGLEDMVQSVEIAAFNKI